MNFSFDKIEIEVYVELFCLFLLILQTLPESLLFCCIPLMLGSQCAGCRMIRKLMYYFT